MDVCDAHGTFSERDTLDTFNELWCGALEETRNPVVLLRVINDRLVKFIEEDIPEHPDRKVLLLKDQRRRLGVLLAFFKYPIEPVEIGNLPSEICLLRAVGCGADDEPAWTLVGPADHAA